MDDDGAVIVGEGDEALTFAVKRLGSQAGRTQWRYTIARTNGPVLHMGDDLYGPGDDPVMAVKSLLNFSGATVDALRHGGADKRGFNDDTIAAIGAVLDDIRLALTEGDAE